jgi:hypothetical protein
MVLTVFLTTLILLTIILSYHQVDNSLTKEDIEFTDKILQEMKVTPISNLRSYEKENKFIIEVQNAVLRLAPDNLGIPYNAQREPRDVYFAKSGLCYDRSRVIEKILRYSGFQTRHIAIYSTEQTHSSFQSLITPGISSHAVTEVLTKKGWLVVDSNDFWVSLDGQGNPVSIEQIQSDVGHRNISWAKLFPSGIYKKSFTFVYGLYSRHGRFYPPYNFIPDVNYKELIQNVL